MRGFSKTSGALWHLVLVGVIALLCLPGRARAGADPSLKAQLRLWQSGRHQETIARGRGGTWPVWIRHRDAKGWTPIEAEPQTLSLLAASEDMNLRLAPGHRPMLDDSVPEIGAELIHHGYGLDRAYKGEGVLIGIIDTGIDYLHPDFLDPDGNTRVVAMWDQDGFAGKEAPGFGYGQYCDARQLQSRECAIQDGLGHGTHVAGIAAGNEGVAPKADIAVVQSQTFTRLADAVSFLTKLARDRGQPLVINLSVGGHYGAHDGRTPFEDFLRGRLGKGEIVVVAAGNDANDRIHVGTELSAEWKRVALEYLPSGFGTVTMMEAWGNRNDSVEVRVELWEGGKRRASVVPSAEWTRLSLPGRAQLDLYLDEDQSGDLRGKILSIDASAYPISPDVEVRIAFRGKGRIDAWLAQTVYGYGIARFGSGGKGLLGGDARSTLTVPSTSPDVVTVGSYNLKTDWVGFDGETYTLDGAEWGSLSGFSGLGPTLAPSFTGPKPDITAPGAMIVSAKPSNQAVLKSDLGPGRRAMQGTSMSSPHVAGIIALMLQADPSLRTSEVRRALRDTARRDLDTKNGSAAAWGAGKLDAQASVALIESSDKGCRQSSAGGWMPLLLVATISIWGPKRRLGSTES